MARNELRAARATGAAARKDALRGDMWAVLLHMRHLSDRWADAWLGQHGYFVAKSKWRIRFLRYIFPETYCSYLASQFPAIYDPSSTTSLREALARLYRFIKEAAFDSSLEDEVGDVLSELKGLEEKPNVAS